MSLPEDPTLLAEAQFSLDSSSLVPEMLTGENLYNHLRGIVRGQDDALRDVSQVVRRCERSHLNKFGRPKASMIFLGPTGVGKTETTKSLAHVLYGAEWEKHVLRFDMAEFKQKESLGIMIGRNRDEQGLLGDGIDRLNTIGGGILHLDEIEKAHEDFQTLFLGATDDARISMANGLTKNLSWLYIIMTANLGGKEIAKMERASRSTIERHVMREASNYFRPEMLARFTLRTVFHRLEYEYQLEICRDLAERERHHIMQTLHDEDGVPVEVLPPTERVIEYLVQRGYDKTNGARPMRSAVEREMGDAVNAWQDAEGNSLMNLAQTNRALAFEVQRGGLVLTTVEAVAH